MILLGLIDAHFARAMAHVLRFMRLARRNRIRAILTPRGLAHALAWADGINNSSVQLVDVQYEKLAGVIKLLQPLKTKLEPYFSRCNEMVFFQSPGSPLDSVEAITAAAREERQFKFTVFAFSGIQGARVCTTLGLKDSETKIMPKVNVQQGDLDAFDVDANSSADLSVLEDTETSSGNRLPTQDAGTPDFTFADTAAEAAVVTFPNSADDGDDDSDGDESSTDGDDSDEDNAANHESDFDFRAYRSTGDDGHDTLSGVIVVKCNGIGTISSSRSHTRRSHVQPEMQRPVRRDLVAEAIRYAAHLIESPQFHIRDGRDDAPEYERARNTQLSGRLQGWARRPAAGNTLGATYMHKYVRDVTEMFNAGVEMSSRKMSPAQIRHALQQRYPGVMCLPSHSEIRTRLSVLFLQSKANGHGVVPMDQTMNSAQPVRRGRKSRLPYEVGQFIEAMVKENPGLKPTEGLRQVREKFPNLDETATDKRIKSKFNSAKVRLKKVALRL